MDSGASEYISSNQAILHDLYLLDRPMMVNLPDGDQVRVTHQGKLRIAHDLILNDMLLVPNFKFNLQSIKRLCKQL